MTLEELADRVEALSAPSREIDADIHEAIGNHVDRTCPIAWHDDSETPPYSSSLDAAMALIPSGHVSPSDFVREALASLGKRFHLHMAHWPLATPFGEWLARYVTAAALRARALSISRTTEGEG